MMAKLTNFYRSKGNLVNAVFLISTLVIALKIQGISGTLSGISGLESGISTCFTRANQTFTAKTLNINSTYTTGSFTAQTEDCFGEMIESAENLKIAMTNLNSLATNVHWFHEALGTPTIKLTSHSQPNQNLVSTRFQSLENLKLAIDESFEVSKSLLASSLTRLTFSFYILAGISFLSMLLLLVLERRRTLLASYTEIDASDEMDAKKKIEVVKAHEIIQNALLQNSMTNSSRLFLEYEKLLTTPKEKLHGKMQATVDKKKKLSKPIFVPVNKFKNLSNLPADEVLMRVVDILSSKIFSNGIKVNLEVAEGLIAVANEEAMEQMFFNLIENSIGSCLRQGATKNDNKVISLKLSSENGQIFFRISDNVAGPDGVSQTTFDICTELMKECGGDVCSLADEVVLKFKQGQAAIAGPVLVDLKKGKKKDLLRSMSSQSI